MSSGNDFEKRGAKRDRQTVTAEGQPAQRQIEGLVIRPYKTQVDRRGEVMEIYDPAWKIHPAPMVFAYQTMVRPKAIKGWIVHQKQDDRICPLAGVMRWVFYDDRKKSPTYRLLNQFTFSERNRALIIIPAGVFHAVQNVGESDAIFVNLPSKPYCHEAPDKYRLPTKNDLIPFDFGDPTSW
jgi:dTDP-4-dehydrorhamnose 3,5-epimerase